MQVDSSRYHPDLRSFSTGFEYGGSLDYARQRADYSVSDMRWDPDIKIRTVMVNDGGRHVVVRSYEPRNRRVTGALLHIHGGAFVLGDLDSEHRRCLVLARHADCLVVSVEYRLAPEHPFPAGIDDCFSVLTWLHENASDFDVDPTRIGIIGSSAGACLAAAVALRARDEGGPHLAVQLLVYPVLDCRLETPSIKTFWDGPGFSGKQATEMWALYGRDLSTSDEQYASPALAHDLSNLPPTYLSVAEFDPLRDEGIQYATRLIDAGVAVELRTFPGTWHGFDIDVPDCAVAQEFHLAEAAAALRRISIPK